MSDGFDYIKYSQDFVKKITDKGIRLKHALLFGSYAKNTYNINSDIDILLAANEFKGAGFIDNALIAEELAEYDKINTITYNSKDYEDQDPLIEEILKTGIRII